jgi:mRNA interferase RelE/StbE
MSYELHFTKSALKEWGGLDATIKEQFKKQLIKRLQEPHVPSARLHGGGDSILLIAP